MRPLWLCGALTLAQACTPTVQVVDVVSHRDNCLVCHQPRDGLGVPRGIEDAHPFLALTCSDCHGGTPRICDEGELTQDAEGEPQCSGHWVYDKQRAHVQRAGGPAYLKNLSATELDLTDRAYLRFINPGDYRVVEQTCGACHAEQTRAVQTSSMTHTAGEVTVARYRAGAQPHPRAMYGALDVVDGAPDPNNACAAAGLQRFDPAPMDIHSTDPATRPDVANAQDLYMVKSCLRCHTRDFGENRFQGDFRSSGCTACHMPYADHGLSRSEDPRVDKTSTPHPERHVLTRAVPVSACTHCHYRGGRLGVSFQGYRESAGAGLNPPNPAVLGVGLHGHDPAYYVTDEDVTNDFDETPPDVHFEAGMHCVDCHGGDEVHGDGHIYADTQCTVKTECIDCHGTARAYAQLDARRPGLFQRDGSLVLRTRVTGKELAVPQVKDSVTPGHPRHSAFAEQSMGVNARGYSHSDTLECYTCHAAWLPSCYGCHVDVDMTRNKRMQTTGVITAGNPNGSRRNVALWDLILMWNPDGMLAPSMPAERLFMNITVKDEEASASQGTLVKKKLLDTVPRTFPLPDGGVMPGFGQRAFNPHTTRRTSTFMACDRCHSLGSVESPENQVLLDITHGFGSRRFPQDGCDVTNQDSSCARATDFMTYQQDAIITPNGRPLVVVGHPDPNVSRPLNLEEIRRMRQTLVPADPPMSTPTPSDALSNPRWPAAQRVE